MPPRSCWITHHEKNRPEKAARSRACTVRIPGVCNHNPETSVLAHYRLAGTCGTAIKLTICRALSPAVRVTMPSTDVQKRITSTTHCC